MNQLSSLKNKILNNDIKVGILGLGYVGLPLAVLFAKKGVDVLGFDNFCSIHSSD